MTREEFERMLIAKAVKDADFRRELVADPKAVLQRELKGVKEDFVLPANLKVSVVEETPDHIYLRLPVVAETMSDKELVGLAGGAGATVTAVTTVTQVSMLDVTAAVNVAITGPAAVVVGGPANVIV